MILRISAGLQSLDEFKDINGQDRRVLAYAHSKPYELPDTLPTALDALEVLRISSGLKQPTIYMMATPPPEVIIYDSQVIELEDNWRFKSSNENFYFVKNQTNVASITASYNSITQKVDTNNIVKTYPGNESQIVSSDGKWMIVYPTTNQNQYSVDSYVKDFKFIYDGYVQIKVTASIDGTSEDVQNGIEYGTMWKLKSEDGVLTFYFRNANSGNYFKQLEIVN